MATRVGKGAAALRAVGLVWALSAGAGCGGGAVHAEEAAYPVTHPLHQDAEITREYVAQVRAIQHIEVRALERGYLDQIFVDEGQPVTKGERLFQILPTLYRAERQKAAAERDYARIEYENTRALAEKDVVAPTELALAKARLDQAEAELALADVHLGFTEIRAPFDGIMGRLEVRSGSLLEEGELLTTLADNRSMWVYFNVSESEYLDYRRRMDEGEAPAVRLRLANGEVFEHEGRVETIEADFNNETGNIAFRATFPNPDGLLRHGETGKILQATALDDVLLVPQKATFDVLDRKYVFVVDAEDTVRQREITVVEELPHLYVLGEGLSADDRILLEGLRKVRDGQHVGAELQEPAEVLASLDLHAE